MVVSIHIVCVEPVVLLFVNINVFNEVLIRASHSGSILTDSVRIIRISFSPSSDRIVEPQLRIGLLRINLRLLLINLIELLSLLGEVSAILRIIVHKSSTIVETFKSIGS